MQVLPRCDGEGAGDILPVMDDEVKGAQAVYGTLEPGHGLASRRACHVHSARLSADIETVMPATCAARKTHLRQRHTSGAVSLLHTRERACA